MAGFQSTPPVWVVTTDEGNVVQVFKISIHTTRVGGDGLHLPHQIPVNFISIHTTRVGGDGW